MQGLNLWAAKCVLQKVPGDGGINMSDIANFFGSHHQNTASSDSYESTLPQWPLESLRPDAVPAFAALPPMIKAVVQDRSSRHCSNATNSIQ
jgi:hypothetical protein